MASHYSPGTFAILSFIALRFVIGCHFFHEGYSKWRDPKPFSGPFFSAAKGPFAPFFQHHIWDRDGLARLNAEETEAIWTKYVAEASRRFGFDEEVRAEADKLLKARLEQYKTAVAQWADDEAEYQYGLERRAANAVDKSREYDSFKKHDARIASDLMPKRMSWQSSIDKIWKGLEADMNKLADGNGTPGYMPIGKPGRFMLDSEMMDQVIPYFHMAVGVLLVIGLFTRFSALLAAGFLASVIASQWPFTPGTISTSYQQVEFFAAITLAAVGAGKWAGLDALFYNPCCRTACSTRPTTTSAATMAVAS